MSNVVYFESASKYFSFLFSIQSLPISLLAFLTSPLDVSLPSLSRIVSPYSVTLFSFVVLLTLINAVCCHVHIWVTLSGCCPGSQFEMPDALESVLQRDRGQSSNYCCGRPHRDMSPANHLLSPSLGNRLMSNQHPATL